MTLSASFLPLPRPLGVGRRLALSSPLLCLLSLACSGGSSGNPATGGAPASGGTGGTTTGGAAPTGGVSGSGGATGGSGATATGGAGTGGSGAATTGGTASGGSPAGGSGGATGGSGATETGGVGAGGSGATGGSGGGGGSGGTAALVEPIMRSADSYVLEFGDTVFEVDPTQGARIVTFSLEGTNLLQPLETLDFLNGGATLWLSPQTWSWPPSLAIDSAAHDVALDGQAIVTDSNADTFDGNSLSVSKRFEADLTAQAIDITYTLNNAGPGAAQHSLWEISRHARGGLSFWASSSTPSGWEFMPTVQDGVMYWDDTQGGSGKIFTEGAGWLAHVEGSLLHIKVWNDVPANQHAPDQGEVEVYLGDGYIELEVQGPYESVPSGGNSTFDVRWFVRAVPPGTDVSVGSQALLDLVSGTIDQGAP